MRILIAHNHYGHYAVGGEATSMRVEAELLRSYGHEVRVYECTNSEIAKRNLWGKIKAFKYMTWSPEGYEAIGKVLDEFKPDVMHVHNYWLMLTPSIFAAAKERGVATVLTLHNYRLVCPGGQFMYRNKPCEQCLNGRGWRVLWRRCYPGKSLLKSLLSFRLYRDTKKREFLSPLVDAYISLTEFSLQKFIEGGLPADKIFVKPNFMLDPLNGQAPDKDGHGAIFVGRLSPEKGLKTLIQAWQDINYPLTIVGDGPQLKELKAMATSVVRFVGLKEHADCLKMILASAFLVFPSEWYETFGRSLLESMAMGRATIATNLGPRPELVDNGKTGLLFEAGNPEDLRKKVLFLIDNPQLCVQMGIAAREKCLQEYNSDKNYQMLMEIYQKIKKTNNCAG